MAFRWPVALWLLLALPALAAAYVAWVRRKRSVPILHLPALLSFVAVAVLLLSVARPIAVLTSTAEEGTVILLMDVSLSMAASDVPPTRLDAARAAAIAFTNAQPRDVRIGVVAFGGYADVVQHPTLERADVIAAIERLQLQRFTAVGNGLMGALLTLFPDAGIGQEYDIFGMGTPAGPQGHTQKPLEAGSDLTRAIVLVSDGRSTMGPPAEKAARTVRDFGVRVFTIGVGTLYGGVANVDGWPAIHAEFDEALLQKIADMTGGEYFLARNADKVGRIYEELGRRVVLRRNEHEVTALFTALAVGLSIAAGALSFGRALQPSR